MNNITVSIYKAQGVVRGEAVPDLVISATGEIPNLNNLRDARELYNDQAVGVVDAMIKCLPGGTVDAILAELMRRRACILRVPLDVKMGDT